LLECRKRLRFLCVRLCKNTLPTG